MHQDPTHSTTKSQTAQPPRSFFRAAAEGFRNARKDAEQSAKDAMPKVQSVCGQAAYDLSYAAGFGTFFSLTMLKELLPERVKKGFSSGAERGEQTAQNISQAVANSSENASAAAI